ncbi:MAG TPA: hypothetical protein DEQ38_11490 [Elusimicrobia bacterium]|nr:MAG: hypothetical protein A2089_03500 [Elusimicrobia bacterium GWD2_63_28]HCC48721.1 hypothetical protein [Elusimicrobiota bacterium]
MKYVLAAFVAVSIGAAIYKALPCCSGDSPAAAAPVTAGAPAELAQTAPAAKPALAVKQASVPPAKIAQKTAVVYYFYTTARCYSCNLIESYTREAVDKHFAQPYNGWRVEFKGLNLDEEVNRHFTQDYWLNSKSVVVQKFEGGKPLNWGMLQSVWQLLGDKEKFMNYVAVETRKVLDSK